MGKFLSFVFFIGTVVTVSNCQSTWNSYWIRTVASKNMCIDVNSARTENGAVVDIWSCVTGATHELFQIKPWADDATYFTINPNHNPGACLSVEGASSTNGARVVGWNCLNAMNQLWTIRQSPFCSRMIYFVSKSSGKCLTFNGAALQNGAGLVIWDCIEQYNQQWYLDVQGYQ